MKLLTYLLSLGFLNCFTCVNYQDSLTINNLLLPTGPNLSRHHIIPSHILRSFFDTALARQFAHGQDYDRTNHFETFVQILAFRAHRKIMDRRHDRVQDIKRYREMLRDALRAGYDLAAGHNYAYDYNTENYAVLKHLFIWFPGNIVVGPRPEQRSDDRANELDEPLLRLFDDENQTRLDGIYCQMLAYINHGETQYEGQLTLPRIASSLLSFSGSYADMKPYDGTRWLLNVNLRTWMVI